MTKGASDPAMAERDRRRIGGTARVCIVTSEVEGPFFNGGVGSTNRGLALALRQLGHAVDILYTQVAEGRPVSLRGSFADHVADFARQGIRLLAIPNKAAAGDWPARSWLALQHLLAERYDLVFFDDIFGTGYYPLLARRTGAPGLAETAMVVTTHGALEWVGEQDQAAILNFDGLPLFEMERRSIELADVVRAPSRYILRKYAGFGWTLPPDPVVMPNFVSDPKPRQVTAGPDPVAVQEIVFFGRLETRKGIWLFLRAIDRIKYDLQGLTISFLGKSRGTGAEILRHAQGWPCKVRLFTDFNQDQALAYLRGAGRLAVMPSPEDNSPSTVLECLDNGIPFLTTSCSGAEELIDPACHGTNLVAPTVEALAKGILQAVEVGGSVARHGFDNDQLLADFDAFVHRALSRRAPAPISGADRGPIAVLALAASDEPAEATAARLRQALAGLGPQAEVHVLCERPKALQALLPKGVRALAPGDLAETAAALTARAPRAVALCPVGEIPGAAWFDRAAACFAGDIRAVTGMARKAEIDPAVPPEEPWFSRAPVDPVDRYLMGNARALLPLLQTTNSGFALLHRDTLPLLPRLDLQDPRQGRLRPAEVIIHELMAAITATGLRFELIPDLVPTRGTVDPALPGRGSAAIALGQAARWLDQPADALWAVQRLAVDAGIDRIRNAEGVAQRETMSRRAGFVVEAMDAASPRDRQSAALARMAAAMGHSDLAVDLLASLHPAADMLRPGQLADFIRAEAVAIDLADLYRRGAFVPVNLVHDYSLSTPSEAELQLHANGATEPRAAIAFAGLDLSQVDAFSAHVSLPDSRSRPVRLRVDLIAATATAPLGVERVLIAGQGDLLRFALPRDLRGPCRVVIGIEMADPQAACDNAYVRLTNARFLRLTRGPTA